MVKSSNHDVVEQIEKVRAAYEEAEKQGDFSAVAPYVAENLVVMPPSHLPIIGKHEWQTTFNEMMADAPEREYEISYSSEETLVSGDLAIDRGTAIDSAEPEGEETLRRGYNYLWVYQRFGDTEWKLSHLLWNSND